MENLSNSDQYEVIREGSRNYLLIRQSQNTGFAEDEWEQFQALSVRGLLPCRKHYRDGSTYLCYDITGKQSLRECFREEQIEYEELRMLLLALDRILKEIHEYLLTEDDLQLRPDIMYTSVDRKELFLVYAKCGRLCFMEQIRSFAEYLLNHMNHKDDRSVMLGYQFYKYATTEHFNMEEFLTENREYLLVADAGSDEAVTDTCAPLRADTSEHGEKRGQTHDEKYGQMHGEKRGQMHDEKRGQTNDEKYGQTESDKEEYYDIFIRREREKEYEREYESFYEDHTGLVTKADKNNIKWYSIGLCVPLLLLAVLWKILIYDRIVIMGVAAAYVTGVCVYLINRRRQRCYREKEKQLYVENRVNGEVIE